MPATHPGALRIGAVNTVLDAARGLFDVQAYLNMIGIIGVYTDCWYTSHRWNV